MDIPKIIMSAGLDGIMPEDEIRFLEIERKLEKYEYQEEEEIHYEDGSIGFTYLKHSKKWFDSEDEIEDEDEWACEIRMPHNTIVFNNQNNEYKFTFDEAKKESWLPPSEL